MYDQNYYASQQEKNSTQDAVLPAILAFVILGVAAAIVAALIQSQRPKKKTGIAGTFENGMEATNKALRNLEKDFNDLRKKVEDRLATR